MTEHRPTFKRKEYIVDGTTARLSYQYEKEERYEVRQELTEEVRPRVSSSKREYYTYKNSRGDRVNARSRAVKKAAVYTDNTKHVPEDFEYEYVTEEEYQEIQKQERARLKRISLPINLSTMIMLTLVLIVAGYVCMSYLTVQADIVSLKNQIASTQSRIERLKSENSNQRAQIEDNIDMQKVYRIATKELGMVHPKKSQVIKYTSKRNDTVHQYGDIPGAEKSTFDKLLQQ